MQRKIIIIIIKNILKYISLFLLGYGLSNCIRHGQNSWTLILGVLLGLLYIGLEMKEM